MNHITQAANTAAEWWAQRLQQGNEEQKKQFKRVIREAVEKGLSERGYVALECDYDPRADLLAAVRAMGIECRGHFFSAEKMLPQKHALEIWPDRMEPKEGYGNWTKTIFFPLEPAP